MRREIFYCFLIVITISVITATDIVCAQYAQYERTYGGYPSSPDSIHNSIPNSIYIANREMMPQSAFFPSPNNFNNFNNFNNPNNSIDNSYKSPAPANFNTSNQIAANSVTPATPFIPEKKTDSENNKEQNKTKQESSINKIKSYFTSLFSSSKTEKSSQKSTDKELLENIDDGQETIEALRKEQNYSIPDYVNSATQSNSAAAKNHYKQGLDFEVQGDIAGAIRSYNAFIAANKKQTINGTLAAPYHRLALIAWKQSEIRNAGVYFRYAMKYALGGNVPIIAGDYALFLIEQNNLKQAEVILRNALIHYPENNRLLYYLGRCTAHQNKPIEAMRYFSASLGEERAYEELVFLYRQRGEFERAEFLDNKRNEYLAKRNKMIPQQVFAAQPATNIQRSVPAAIPTTPPPIIPNSQGILSHGTMRGTMMGAMPEVMPATVQGAIGTSLPVPTFDNPNKQNVRGLTNTNNHEISLPYGTRTIPEDTWQPLDTSSNTLSNPLSNPSLNPLPVPVTVSPLPVSKVFHYSEDQTVPTYYEFRGEQYPQNLQKTTPANTNVLQTSFAP
ncbi:MAG: hypothetical protein LBP87_00045 [Planctomycetaceae bacterium]|nr:hypothetical protein [Planctomycetaceae bacterium]